MTRTDRVRRQADQKGYYGDTLRDTYQETLPNLGSPPGFQGRATYTGPELLETPSAMIDPPMRQARLYVDIQSVRQPYFKEEPHDAHRQAAN